MMFRLKGQRNLTNKGFSLVELILALAILAVLTSAIIIVLSYVNKATIVKGRKLDAVNYGQEGMEAVLAMKQEDFSELDPGPNQKYYHLTIVSDEWQLNEYPDENSIPLENDLKRIVKIERVFADGEPPVAKILKITIKVVWTDASGASNEVIIENLISNWSKTINANIQSNWCNIDLETTTTTDLVGSQKARNISVHNNTVSVTTGLDLSVGSKSFARLVSNTASLNAPTYADGYVTKGIHTFNGKTYLLTDSNKEEVVIYDVTSAPFTKVGFFNAGGCDCKSPVDIQVRNEGGATTAYLLMADRLITFNVSTLNGATSQSAMSEYVFTNEASSLFVRGNYAFVGFKDNNANQHMTVIDISDPNQIVPVPQSDLSLEDPDVDIVKQIYSNAVSSRTYLLTNKITTTGVAEFYIIDTTDKSNMTILDSYDTQELSPNAFAPVTDDIVVIGGSVATPSSEAVIRVVEGLVADDPVLCTSLTDTAYNTVYDLDYRNETSGTNPAAYLYLTTNDTKELHMIRGEYLIEGGVDYDPDQKPITRLNN